jgi:hypothetical protein
VDPNPFAPARNPEAAPAPIPWGPTLAWGLPASVLGAAAELALSRASPALPSLPWPAIGGLALAAAAVAALVAAGKAPRAALIGAAVLFAGTCLVPLPGGERAGVASELRALTADLVWGAVVWGPVAAAWLQVPPARWPSFVGVAAAKHLAVTMGWQFLLPGFGLTVLLATVELEAADGGEGSWTVRAIRSLTTRPKRAAVAIGAALSPFPVILLLALALTGVEGAQALFLDPSSSPAWVRGVTDFGSVLVRGLGLAWAARMRG